MEKFANANPKDRATGLLAIRAKTKTINSKDRQCVISRHPLLGDGQVLRCAVVYARAIEAGHFRSLLLSRGDSCPRTGRRRSISSQ